MLSTILKLSGSSACCARKAACAPVGITCPLRVPTPSPSRAPVPNPRRLTVCRRVAAEGSSGASTSGEGGIGEDDAPKQMSVYEVAAANAIKTGRTTDLDKASRALVHKLMEGEEGCEVEVWATGSIMQLAALKIVCKAQSFAAERGFTLKMVPFEEEQEFVRPSGPPKASRRNKGPQEPDIRRKVVWVVSKLDPPMDLDKAMKNKKRVQLHRQKESWAQVVAQVEAELDEEGKAIAIEFMGEKPSKVLTNAMLRLFARCQSDDDYLLLPTEGSIAGFMAESSKLPGYVIYMQRCFAERLEE